jgi:hypothetical protein
MKLTGSSPVLLPPKPRQTTSGKETFVSSLRSGSLGFLAEELPALDTAGETEKNLEDTFSNFHDYTIDWQPDTLKFLIDGKEIRSIQKSDTIDASGVAHYPTTPSRVQLR